MTLPYDINRRNSLLDKFRNDMLDRDDAEELKQILETERKQAAAAGRFSIGH